MNLHSIQGRLNLYLVLGLGAILTVCGLVLNAYLKESFLERFDADVLGRAQMLATMTGIDEGAVELEFADEFMPEFSEPEGPEFFQLWYADGALLERSESLEERDLPRVAVVLTEPLFRDLILTPGGRCRLVQISFIPEDETRDLEGQMELEGHEDGAMIICLAKNRESFDRFLRQTQLAILGSFLALLLVLLFFVRKALAVGLEPLGDMRRQVAGLEVRNLGTPIRLNKETQELMPVVEQLNLMLSMLGQAMARERMFTSNVAHELRTPIAELRSIAEVSVKILDNPQATQRFFNDVKEIAVEMEQLVANLLSLSRCDSGTQMITTSEFDLVQTVHKAWKRASLRAEAKDIRLELDLPEELRLTSDESMTEQVVQNLINNAVAHSPPACTVRVTAEQADGTLSLVFSNPGPQLRCEDLKHMFDRFWQKDAARTGGKHAGLGLSLVRSFADLLGYGLRLELEGDHQFVIAVAIPRSMFAPQPQPV